MQPRPTKGEIRPQLISPIFVAQTKSSKVASQGQGFESRIDPECLLEEWVRSSTQVMV